MGGSVPGRMGDRAGRTRLGAGGGAVVEGRTETEMGPPDLGTRRSPAGKDGPGDGKGRAWLGQVYERTSMGAAEGSITLPRATVGAGGVVGFSPRF